MLIVGFFGVFGLLGVPGRIRLQQRKVLRTGKHIRDVAWCVYLESQPTKDNQPLCPKMVHDYRLLAFQVTMMYSNYSVCRKAMNARACSSISH